MSKEKPAPFSEFKIRGEEIVEKLKNIKETGKKGREMVTKTVIKEIKKLLKQDKKQDED